MVWNKVTMWLAIGLVDLGAAVAMAGLGRPLWAQTVPGGPTLMVSDQAVTATGMTPGGTVVWLGMGRKAVEYEAAFVRRRGSLQADAQGQAQIPLTEAVPPQSIWAAIDLASGAYATTSPAGFTPLTLTLGPEAFELRGTGLADRLADVADYAEVLLVRPGKGAWGKAVGRGGADDEGNPGDAAFRLAFDRLEPLPGTTAQAPGKLSAKDLIFVLHPQAMALAVVSFGGRP
jgi:hypothetical protein